MTTLQRGEHPLQPGQWKPLLRGDHTRSATLCCPQCRQLVSITNHGIAADGTVTPSVICTVPVRGLAENVECPQCGWHDIVTLVGWALSSPPPANRT